MAVPEVKIIKPGDPEFDEIARQCTPPKKIRVRHGMNRIFIEFGGRRNGVPKAWR